MMHRFIANNRDELIKRCAAKVALRPSRAATEAQLKNGIPMFIQQLERTLKAEEDGHIGESTRISGNSGGDFPALSEMGVSATAHGKELLLLGFSVDQVVHDYGDLCQAITDLAFERDSPFGIGEFRTLNRCLDNAIADAVTEFSSQRDAAKAIQQDEAVNERVGFLVHELRNALGTAMLAASALETGNLPMTGATGSVLKRSHSALKTLVDGAMEDVRARGATADSQVIYLAPFLDDARSAASLYASTTGCTLVVLATDSTLAVCANRERLLGAVTNLLQNAFKFTRPKTAITLSAYAQGQDVRIDVADHCGGLPRGDTEVMFLPFTQRSADRSGLGLGLSISRQSIERDGGKLTAADVPGTGCVFAISMPRHVLTPA